MGHGQTQSEMNQAAILDLKSTEDELTRVYQKVIQRYSKGSDADLALVDKLRKGLRGLGSSFEMRISSRFPIGG